MRKSSACCIRCLKDDPSEDSFTDLRDGKTYKTIKIGEQIWMAENLNYECKGSAYYDNDPSNEKYGRLYTHNATKEACPPDWHLPTKDEWEELFDLVCESVIVSVSVCYDGKIPGKTLKYRSSNLMEKSGFAALLGGTDDKSYWWYAGTDGYWKVEGGLRWEEFFDNDFVVMTRDIIDFGRWDNKDSLFSIRCVKGETIDCKKIAIKNSKTVKKGAFTDPRDGKKYKTVKIDKQIWMAENLNYECDGSLYVEKYGRYYKWKTAKQVCPPGWHLPSKEELEVFIKAVGSEDTGDLVKAKLGWLKTSNGYDIFGFAALPGGAANQFGVFRHAGEEGSWWSITEGDANKAYLLKISEDMYVELNQKDSYHNIRCVKDDGE